MPTEREITDAAWVAAQLALGHRKPAPLDVMPDRKLLREFAAILRKAEVLAKQAESAP
jgi:hypothetical protein